MKKCAWLLMLVLLCSLVSCGTEQMPEGNCALYYAALPEYAKGGDAVAAEYCEIDLPEDTAAAAEMLLRRYWKGPTDESLSSPLPAGLQLLGVEAKGGLLEVNVSGHYRTLSGVDLTLADSCLTLTLTQLPGVYSVSVLAGGKPLEYRAEQELQLRDVLLSTSEDLVGTVTATLWFVDETTGALVSEKRKIPVYEGKTRAESVLDALKEEPENEALLSPVPEEFTFLSVRVEDEICYVNLPAAGLDLLEGGESLMLQAAAESLCSLQTVNFVRYLVDGEFAAAYGGTDITDPYTAQVK